MKTKDKFIQLSVIHSTKREQQTIIALTEQGRILKGTVLASLPQDTSTYTWREINLPEEFQQ